MNRLVKLGLAAAFALSGASLAISQDTTGSIGPTWDTLLSTVNAASTPDLAAITDTTTVNFVTVSSLQAADPMALDTALEGKTDQMASLHAAIEANAALKAKIEAGGYTVDKVLGVEQGDDGSFSVYIDDRA